MDRAITNFLHWCSHVLFLLLFLKHQQLSGAFGRLLCFPLRPQICRSATRVVMATGRNLSYGEMDGIG